MYKKFFIYIILILLQIYFSSSIAQSLSFTSYTIKEGLPSNNITAIFQDSKGYLWIGTNNGLCRYDGNEFKIFSTLNGLSNNWITSIMESPFEKGTMWIGTIAGGVNRFSNGTFKPFKYGIETEWNNISDFCVDKNGTVWIVSARGLLKIHNDSIKIVRNENSPKDPSEILIDSAGNIWCSEKNQVYVYAHSTSSWNKLNISLNEISQIVSLLKDSENKIWAGTSDKHIVELNETGIVRKEKTVYGIPYQVLDNGDNSFLMRDRNIFSFVSKKTPGNQRLISMPEDENMPGDVTSPFLIDREGNTWIGTWLKGLLKVSNMSLYLFQFPGTTKLNWNNIDHEGNIWLGAEGGVWEIYLDNSNQWQKKFHSLNLGQQAKIFISAIDSKNNLWLHLIPQKEGPNYQTYVYNIVKNQNGSGKLIFPGHLNEILKFINNEKNLLSYYADRLDRLWINTVGSVVLFDLKTSMILKTYTLDDGIPGKSVRLIYQDSQNQIWMGGWETGISIFSSTENSLPSLKKKITIKDGLPDNMIRSIYEDSKGNIWIGTRHNGIVILQNNSFKILKKISMKDGLLSNSIWEIIEGPDNKMWLNTDVGIEEVDLPPKESLRKTLKVLPPKKEFMLSFDRLLTIRNYKNKYWSFCSNEELFIYESNQRKKTSTPPLIDLTKILVNGNIFSISKLNELSYTQNNITIEFAGLSFKEERGVRYQYRLFGADTNWTSPSDHRQVSFAALRPGDYIFEVRAINSEGIISDLPASFEFKIIPPFWFRWWFIVFTISALTILLFLFHRYRIKQLLKMESLRVRISSDLHDEIGSSVGSIVLRSRMLHKEENWNTKSKEELGRIQHTAIQTSEVLRDIVWFVNPGFDKLDDMILRMKDTAQSLLSGISYEFVSPDEILSIKLSLEFRRNIFLSYKEILHNIAKHSKATEAKIEVVISNGNFSLLVIDNGIGFDPDNNKTSGSGLSSLSKRMESIKGKFEINSAINQGTTIKLTAKTT